MTWFPILSLCTNEKLKTCQCERKIQELTKSELHAIFPIEWELLLGSYVCQQFPWSNQLYSRLLDPAARFSEALCPANAFLQFWVSCVIVVRNFMFRTYLRSLTNMAPKLWFWLIVVNWRTEHQHTLYWDCIKQYLLVIEILLQTIDLVL